jgi:uncharacterized membrane protein
MQPLTPEERRKIYEEEKARLEVREHLEREQRETPGDTSTGISQYLSGLLCYVGLWVTGIIFLVLERRNRWVRFHAAQSLVTFGALFLFSLFIGWIPFIGRFFSVIIGITTFVLWIVLMVRAYQGERFRVPVAAELAEAILAAIGPTADYPPPPPVSPAPPAASPAAEKPGIPPPAPPPPPAASLKDAGERVSRRPQDFFELRRAGRITGSAFVIAWCIALLVFFNYYYQYFAYYHPVTSGGNAVLERLTFFTPEIHRWLPLLNATLIVTIVAHIILIIYDRYALRQALHIVTGVMGFAAVVALLVIFPFDFTVLPTSAGAAGTQFGARIILALIALGIGVSIVVRLIKLIVNLVTGKADYHRAV